MFLLCCIQAVCNPTISVTYLLQINITVNKLHIACPLTTFQEVEAFEAAALKSSFFMPKQEEVVQEEAPKKDKKRDKSVDSKSSKGSSKKSKKGGAGGDGEMKNLKEVVIIQT